MVRYTLKQCAYFIAVVEEGGIAQASRALNISQPAIAQALDKLEDLYGFQLLLRHHARGTELTPQGRAFLSIAHDLVRQADYVEREAQAIAANKSGSIRFGCFHTIAPFYMGDLISKYRQREPDIRIEAQELLQDEIVNGVLELV